MHVCVHCQLLTSPVCLQLRDDLMRLPDQATEAQYDAVPVAEFGMALLRGMGWSEGRALGRRAAEVSAQPPSRTPVQAQAAGAPACTSARVSMYAAAACG